MNGHDRPELTDPEEIIDEENRQQAADEEYEEYRRRYRFDDRDWDERD